MKNEEFINMIRQIKKEGVTYKAIARDCNIPSSRFYYYLNNKCFPYELRKQMEYKLMDKYREIIEL